MSGNLAVVVLLVLVVFSCFGLFLPRSFLVFVFSVRTIAPRRGDFVECDQSRIGGRCRESTYVRFLELTLCVGSGQTNLRTISNGSDPFDIASHTSVPEDAEAGWRKSAAVKRNSFEGQAFLARTRTGRGRRNRQGRARNAGRRRPPIPLVQPSQFQIDQETEQ